MIDDEGYVEPKNPYVEIEFKEVGTGRTIHGPVRLINGDTMTVWTHAGTDTFAGIDTTEQDR